MPAGGTTVLPASRTHLTERHVLALGLALSGTFVGAALLVAVLALAAGGSTWAALHLALGGAAATAIGTFMPHFAVTLAGTRPQPVRLRLVQLGLLSGGASAAVLGVTLAGGNLALVGAVAMLAGVGLTAWQVLAPLREPLARRHPIVTLTYLVALTEMAAAVSLGGLAAAGFAPVLGAWATLRGAHAWLALPGAVTLTIFGTLVYLAPTILGARIRPSPMLVLATIGLLVGPPLAAAGFALASTPVVLGGMGLATIGAAGQVGYVIDVARRRGRYTSEHDWRRASAWHIVAGPGWLVTALAVALVEIIGGRPIAGWSLGALAIPLVGGWLLQELVGSWTHLAPAVTPGNAARHAAQRRRLAPASRLRPIAWNVGVAATWAGMAAGVPALTATGSMMLAGTLAASVVLLARSLWIGR